MRCPMCRVSSPGQDVYQTEHQRKPPSPSPKVVEAVKSAAGEGWGSIRIRNVPGCVQPPPSPWGNTGTGFPGNGSDEVLAFCFQAFF